jgi:alpha-D-ribose 1-methylphosphonate 5-triphosphate synthase subunit PhnL
MATHLEVKNLSKLFELHILGGKEIVAFQDINFRIDRGRFLGISGKSGYGKSSLIKCIYRNYDVSSGEIWLHDEAGGKVDLTQVSDIEMLEIRRLRMGYVSQFFQPIPRVTTMKVVIEPLIDKGWERARARARAEALFKLFDIPANLWDAYPSTFSGGEKQRINLMRTLIDCPEILLLDEPTASLDRNNREIILNIIQELKRQEITMIGIFHNPEELALLSDEILPLERPGEVGASDSDNHLVTSARFAFQVGR